MALIGRVRAVGRRVKGCRLAGSIADGSLLDELRRIHASRARGRCCCGGAPLAHRPHPPDDLYSVAAGRFGVRSSAVSARAAVARADVPRLIAIKLLPDVARDHAAAPAITPRMPWGPRPGAAARKRRRGLPTGDAHALEVGGGRGPSPGRARDVRVGLVPHLVSCARPPVGPPNAARRHQKASGKGKGGARTDLPVDRRLFFRPRGRKKRGRNGASRCSRGTTLAAHGRRGRGGAIGGAIGFFGGTLLQLPQ